MALLFALVALRGTGAESARNGAESPRVFCLSRAGLAEAKALVARDDPSIRPALRRLVQEADLALDVGPFSVVLKSRLPESGNKHDYHSLSPYHWPDPEKPDGLPYRNRDGFTNPEWWQDYDRVPLERLVQACETLALAYTFTGRPHYAGRVAHLVRIWFLDPATAMTPDLIYAQAIPGARSGHTQVIDTRFLPRLIDAVGLIGTSQAWTEKDQAGLVAWFRAFLTNVRRRADEGYRNSVHNIASFYHVQTAAIAMFVGDEAQARELVERTKARLALAVEPDGFFQRERRRTRSLSYSCFHLYALFNLATMGRLLDLDLWNFTTPDGRGLRLALDTVARHAGPYPPKHWPLSETGHTPGDWWDPFHDQLPSVLHHAALAYREKSYAEKIPLLLGDPAAIDRNRLHLLCGLPLPGQQALDGWLFHPSSAEAAAAETFVRVSPRDARYLELTDGRPYVPIGLNLIAPSVKPEAGEAGLAAFEQWCRRLAENRGNFIRVWLSHGFWDVEPRQSGVYDEAQLGRIRAMLALARRHGLRVKLCLEHFRSLDPNYKQTWSQKLIHRADRGGPAVDMEDFFLGERSRAQFRGKLAWFAERLGEDPTIFAWELWNEVNAVQAKSTAYMPWTQEMLGELHRLFPRQLAVQSLGSFDRDSSRAVYREHSLMPGNDLAQVHRYLDLGAQLKVCHGPVDVLAADAVRELLAWNPGRPVLLAESGAVEPGHTGPFKLYAEDKAGVILHDVLFAPFFAGAAGPGHCWHWGQYVDANNLWHHFGRFAAAIEGLDPAGGNLQPRSWETDRLRVYALVGDQEVLLWCRDVRNTWSRELTDGTPPETITGHELDLASVLQTSGVGRVRCYDPWTDQWSEAPRRGAVVTLPAFARSVVLRFARR